MNPNHLDARAITQPGGLYQGINDALLQSLAAYFQSKDRERQGQRDVVRDERTNRLAQYRQALNDAATLGVKPSAENSGWLAPEDQAGIDAAVARFQKSQQDDALMRAAKRMQLIQSGVNPGDMTPDEARAFQAAAQRKALDDQHARLGLKADQVKLGAMRDEAFWNTPVMRGVRGVGDTVKHMAVEAAKNQGRKRDDPDLQMLRKELIQAETTQMHTPWNQATEAPLSGDNLEAYRVKLRQMIAQREGSGAPGVAAQPAQTEQDTGTLQEVMRRIIEAKNARIGGAR